jgi:hypothetical protein
MKTTKENRNNLRSYAVSDWHRDQMFSSKAIEALLDDIDHIEAENERLRAQVESAKSEEFKRIIDLIASALPAKTRIDKAYLSAILLEDEITKEQS